MGRRYFSTRARTRVWAIVVGTVLGLVVPAVALAGNTATFTSVAPRAGSSSVVATPAISVVVYDKYGVRGASGYSMTVDGASVKPAISYLKGYGYKKFRLTYKSSVALAVGTHAIRVVVKDLKRRSSSLGWTYTVLAPPGPAEMPVTVLATDCAACHAGFPSAHPMTECAGCHGPGSPPRPAGSIYGPGTAMENYTPANLSAHTRACALSHCHSGSAVFFPHTLDANCSRCHNAAYPLIPQVHAALPADAHVSSNTFCVQSGCHLGSLTQEHYRHAAPSGAPLACATCHGSSDPAVVAAIRSGSTDCGSCHGGTDFVHANTAVAHAASGRGLTSCVRADCHGTDLASVHAGRCGLCHAASASPTVRSAVAAHDSDCVTCHGTPTHTSLHELASPRTDACAGSDCHDGTNLTALRIGSAPAAKHAVCTTCHGAGAPQAAATAIAAHDKRCAACHSSGLPVTHTTHAATVTAAPVSINGHSYGSIACTSCHGNAGTARSIIDLQQVTGHTSCSSCHPSPAGAASGFTCDQVGCHGGGTLRGTALPEHAGIGPAHDTVASVTIACGATGCHDTGDVALIHAAVPGRADHGCGICHDGSIVAAPTKNCSAAIGCHAAYYPNKPAGHLSHVATVTAAVISINGAEYGSHACAECHGNSGTGNTAVDLQRIPGHASCAACHASAAGLARRADFTCGQAPCHGAGTLSGTAAVQHAGIAAAHSNPATATNCVTPACHTYGTDVAAIHDHIPGVAGNGCYICHNGRIVATPTTDCSAATGCHRYGAPGVHASHPANDASITIRIASVDYPGESCSDCHAPLDLQKVPQHTSCTTCHPSPADSAGKLDFSCAQGGCHTSGSRFPMHASVTATHSLDTTPSCVGDGCHLGGKNAAAIHSYASKRSDHGCGICHVPGRAPTLTCAVCHGTGMPDSHTSHVPTATTSGTMRVNGISYGTHRCSECHAPYELQAQHGEDGTGSSCAKCHPAPARTATGFDCSQPACHQTAAGNMQVMHAGIDTSHETTQGLRACGVVSGCHGDKLASLAALHSSVDTVTPGGAHLVSCQACHANPAHGPSQVCSDCHVIHDFAALHTVREQTAQCTTCHAGDLRQVHLGCGCHTSADPAVIAAIKAGDHRCATCHGPGYPAGHTSHVSTQTAGTITIDGTDYTGQTCATCHTPLELQSLHGEKGTFNSCATCHTDPGAPLRTGTFTCAQTGCHASTSGAMLQQHVSVTASHTLDTTPTCIATGCHVGGRDVASIHAHAKGVTGSGCHICHDGSIVRSPTLDCATKGCHDTLDHIAKHDLPPTRTDECVTCHAGTNLTSIELDPGQVSPKHALCATCHSSADTSVTGSIAAHDMTCTRCHADLDHIGKHDVPAPRTDPCVECHPGGNLTVIHDSARVPCATCHRSTDPNVVAAIAANDPSTLTCFACHPTAHAASHAMCAACHVHVANDPNDPRIPYEDNGPTHWPLTLNGRACSSCHSAPFKPLAGLGASHRGCAFGNGHNGCHVGTPAADQHYVDRSKDVCTGSACHVSTLTNLTVLHPAGCATCHGPGAPKAAQDAIAAHNRACSACHGPGVPVTHASHIVTAPLTATITIDTVSYGRHACTECHAVMELQTVHGGAGSCGKCHPAPAASVQTGTFACSQPSCHDAQAGNMKVMHAAVTPDHDTTSVAGDADCLGCHNGTLAALHVTATTTVNAVVVTSCAVCHANTDATVSGAMKPGLVPSCVDCHGGDLNTIHPGVSHTTTRAVDQVSWGMDNDYHNPPAAATTAMNCSDCHTYDLLALHANYCGVCHSPSARAAVKAAIARHSTNCADCHPNQHMADVPAHDAEYDANDYNRCGWCHGGSDGCTRCHPAWTPVPTPVTSSDATASYTGNSGNATITLSATDNVYGTFGISGTYHILDGAQTATGTQILVPYPASGTTSHTLTFWSTDWSGHVETSHTVSFTVAHDSLPPVTTSTIVAGQYYTGAQTFTLSAVDRYSGVAGTFWRLDATSGAWTSGTSVPVPAPTGAGKVVHTLYFYSTDTAGNTESVRSVTFIMAYGVVFSYTPANQTFVVPAGVTQLRVTLKGASGGDDPYTVAGYGAYGTGGQGGTVVDTITVTPGATLTVRVGSIGMSYAQGSPGGWPNGGYGTFNWGAGGGGSSTIASGAVIWAEAGGGGGAGWLTDGTAGGAQGNGAQDANHGSQTGGSGLSGSSAGGGGGGWNKGAGGATVNSAGSGGTSFVAVGVGTLALGGNIGNGSVTINY